MEYRCLASLSAETNLFLWYFGVWYGRLFLRGKHLINGVVKLSTDMFDDYNYTSIFARKVL